MQLFTLGAPLLRTVRENPRRTRGIADMDVRGAIADRIPPSRQELMELVIDESESAMYVTDAKANIVFINKTFTAMLG